MKIVKNIFASLLAVMLIFVMAVPVLAEGETDGSITITNALPETDYKIYKIFDVTIGSESEPQSYAYTYNTNIGKASHEEEFFTALSESSPFDLVESPTDSGIYEVTLKADMAASDIMIFLKAQADNLVALSNVGVRDDDAKTVTFSGLEYAYYYVATASGAALGIDTSSPDATIEEKSQRPGPVDGVYKVFVDDNGDVILGDDGLPLKTNTANCGDVIKYVLLLKTSNYCEGKRIFSYIATDSLGKGLTDFKVTSITVDDIPVSENFYFINSVDPENEQYGSAVEIDILWSNDSFNIQYREGAILKIYCEATLTEDARPGPFDDPSESRDDYNKNKVKFSWKYFNEAIEEGEEYKVTTRTYAIGILKTSDKVVYNPNDESEIMGVEHLKDVEFELTNTNGNKVPLKEVGEKGGYTDTWYVYDKEGSAIIKSNAFGAIYIMGLAGDETYTLTETKALPGYNLLKESKTITPEDIKTSTRSSIEYSWDDNGKLINYIPGMDRFNGVYFTSMCFTLHVINAAGTELPSTGGIGTTIFYVVGGLLVASAGVFFISRKRMHERR